MVNYLQICLIIILKSVSTYRKKWFERNTQNKLSGVKSDRLVERPLYSYNPDAQNLPHLYSRVVNLMDPLDSLCKHMISRLQQAILDHNISVPTQLFHLFPKPASPLQMANQAQL